MASFWGIIMSGWFLIGSLIAAFFVSFAVTEMIMRSLLVKAERSYDKDVIERPISVPAHINGKKDEIGYLRKHKENHLSEVRLTYRFFQVVACILLTIILTFITSFHSVPFVKDVGVWGALGDYFGGILNPILGFASFIALLYTIRLQSKELAMTREELARSADASEKSGKALSSQLRTLERQAFENTLFKFFDTVERKFSQLKEREFEIKTYDLQFFYSSNGFECEETYVARRFGFHDFVKYLNADSSFGFFRAITELSETDLRQVLQIEAGQNSRKCVVYLPDDLGEVIWEFNLQDFDSIDLYFALFNYLDSNNCHPEVFDTYLELLKSCLDESFAFCILLKISSNKSAHYKELTEKYGLLEQLIIDEMFGFINFGNFSVDDFDFEDGAYGNNHSYREFNNKRSLWQ